LRVPTGLGSRPPVVKPGGRAADGSPGSGLATTSSRLNRALRQVSCGRVSCLVPAAPLLAGCWDAVLVRGICGPAATGVVRDARQAFTPPVPLQVCRACWLWLSLLAVEGCLGPRGGSGPLSPETRQSGRAYGSRWRGGAALGRSAGHASERSGMRRRGWRRRRVLCHGADSRVRLFCARAASALPLRAWSAVPLGSLGAAILRENRGCTGRPT